ncbi:MAG: serine/threonine-protein kinase [Gemmataceae bacterium]
MSDRSSPPPQDARLLGLFDQWHSLRAAGKEVTAAELCADCPELAADLDRLIRGEGHLARLAGLGLNDLSTVPPSGQTVGPVPSLPPPIEPSTPTIPRYEIEELLGRGGMGAVYRAHDRLLHRRVALKVIRPEAFSHHLRERFLAEARAVARMSHPHIVTIFDVGEWQPPGGGPSMPYLALEYVPGGSLSRRAGTEPLTPAEAARLVRLLARAMHHAHAQGIVHRDLKLDNVLLADRCDEPGLNTALGCPKVTDFGLARQVTADHRLSTTGAVMGTPTYMAPEQAEGAPDVGPPADVYALGVILYRLLTGRVPFSDPSLVNLRYKVCHETPPPIRQLRPEVPEELERICLAALAKAPADRPTAAGAGRPTRQLVHRFEETTLVAPPAVPPPPPVRSRRWWPLVGLARWSLCWPWRGGGLTGTARRRGHGGTRPARPWRPTATPPHRRRPGRCAWGRSR